MADEQYQTNVSIVFWTADTDSAQAEIERLREALPEDARNTMRSAIVFVPEGKPEPIEPME